jgi:hypothetical protein
MSDTHFYVYVYIDPRNHEEFYYGKGAGPRKSAHLDDKDACRKVERIEAIRKAGQEPIIRVVAANLDEKEALLIEATLIWRFEGRLTNQVSGHFSEKFRPQDTLHKNLPGFDYENYIYYVNVGEGSHRDWIDCRRYGFLSAGGENPRWKSQLQKLIEGDVVAAYLAGHGYVGIGIVTEQAVPMKRFIVDGVPLGQHSLAQPGMLERIDDTELTEYVVRIKWIKTVDKEQAFFKPKSGLFTTQQIRASLSRQPTTISFIDESFDIRIEDLLSESHRHTQDQSDSLGIVK